MACPFDFLATKLGMKKIYGFYLAAKHRIGKIYVTFSLDFFGFQTQNY